jgi:hypothetical protein
MEGAARKKVLFNCFLNFASRNAWRDLLRRPKRGKVDISNSDGVFARENSGQRRDFDDFLWRVRELLRPNWLKSKCTMAFGMPAVQRSGS